MMRTTKQVVGPWLQALTADHHSPSPGVSAKEQVTHDPLPASPPAWVTRGAWQRVVLGAQHLSHASLMAGVRCTPAPPRLPKCALAP